MLFFNIQDNLKETEEKYRKAMVSIAQLDNEKQALLYQVDCLKDRYSEAKHDQPGIFSQQYQLYSLIDLSREKQKYQVHVPALSEVLT